MALEAVVYPLQDLFSYGCSKDFCFLGANYGFDLEEDNKLPSLLATLQADRDSSSSSSVMQHANSSKEWEPHCSPENCTVFDPSLQLPAGGFPSSMEPPVSAVAATADTTNGRRKRRRTKTSKNQEEMENQRMTHIAVERNRRKQMNEYLAVLRSLMPPSYVQRGDQASIIGGAINFVKELEQLLSFMEAHKRTTQQQSDINGFVSPPFADFFTFPQYSTHATAPTQCKHSPPVTANDHPTAAESVADIEVTMVESHANLKILAKKQHRQLLKMVAGLQGLRLSILHLNVTTFDQLVLYSVSVKIEEGCHLNTVDDIAGALNQMLLRIQEEEAAFS